MATHHKGPAREVRALDAFIKLMRAADTVARRLEQSLADEGLTLAQLGVLEALLHLGPMNQATLGAKLLRSKANMTQLLCQLEDDGLVKRERSELDRRAIELSLTRAGRARIERVFPRHAARIAELFAALSPDEQARLGALCRKLGLAGVTQQKHGGTS